MATLLDIKNFVANHTGKDNGSTAVPKRDRLINAARRQFYTERPWSFLKDDDTLTFTSQEADLPADFNEKFDPLDIYKYDGNVKYQFKKVDWSEVDNYLTDQYVYAIDRTNGKVRINTSDSSLTILYTKLPADKAIDTSANSDTEDAPDITPIGLLATAMWWLSSERSTAKYQLFYDQYNDAMARAVRMDAQTQPVKLFSPYQFDDRKRYVGRV